MVQELVGVEMMTKDFSTLDVLHYGAVWIAIYLAVVTLPTEFMGIGTFAALVFADKLAHKYILNE